MGKVIKRKCAVCDETMIIDRNNVQDVIIYGQKCYHKKCFITHATERSQSKRGKPKQWADALDNIDIYEQATKETLGRSTPSDKLNDWLLDHYDITSTPSRRFWSTVRDLENGEYRNKKCRAIDIESLTEAWKWAQHNLDKIAVRNKSMNNNIDGEARIYYDLAIILKKYPIFLKWKDRQRAAAAAAMVQETQRSKINYNNIEKQMLENQKDNDSLDDISDLLDELF